MPESFLRAHRRYADVFHGLKLQIFPGGPTPAHFYEVDDENGLVYLLDEDIETLMWMKETRGTGDHYRRCRAPLGKACSCLGWFE